MRGQGGRKRNGWQAAALAISFGDTLPTEFRIFAAGQNTTAHGMYLFDDQAAALVMAAYQAHGIDVAIDLEHLSIEDPETSRNFDPDARGWCKLAVRNGELWAVDVTWTPDGTARLSERRQRYVSPVFSFNIETRRVTAILNIAITAMPATDNLEPLIAASRRQKLALSGGGDPGMTPEQFAAIAEALGLGADANVEDVIATISAMVKKITDAANGDGDPEDAAEAPEGAPLPMVAAARIRTAARVLARLSGKREISAVVTEVEAWHKSHVDLETQRTKLTHERATLESGERRRLVAELVKLGAEPPATAWADDTATKPAEPWASMAIASLRERVTKLAKAKGVTPPAVLRPPPGGGTVADEDGGQAITIKGEVVQLSAREVQNCKESGAKLEDYAANRVTRDRAKAARTTTA